MCMPALGSELKDDFSEQSTPPRQSAIRTSIEVVKTPGQLLSQKQAEFFRRDNFEKALGSYVVDFNWDVLEDSSLSPHNTEKRENINRLRNVLKRLSKSDKGADRLYVQILKFKDDMEEVHRDRLENVVSDFFESKFPGAEITSYPKNNGVQLGEILTVKNGNETRRFFVKTHAQGKLTSKSTRAKQVSVRELLAYKTLEHMGIGPQTHFCARSAEDVYIATLEAGYGGEFYTFDKAADNQDTVGLALWGGVNNYTGRRVDDYDYWRNHDATLSGDRSAQHFMEQMLLLDVTSRILRLHDLLDNNGNFGFFTSNEDPLPKARIIDFRVPVDEQIAINSDHFGGFKEGNSIFNHGSAHKTVSYALHYRILEERIKGACTMMKDGPLAKLPDALKDANKEVQEFITQNRDLLGDHAETMNEDLEVTCDTYLKNHEFFFAELNKWSSIDKVK